MAPPKAGQRGKAKQPLDVKRQPLYQMEGYTWCRKEVQPNAVKAESSEAKASDGLTLDTIGKAEVDSEGQMSARDGCSESVASSSTCIPATADAAVEECGQVSAAGDECGQGVDHPAGWDVGELCTGSSEGACAASALADRKGRAAGDLRLSRCRTAARTQRRLRANTGVSPKGACEASSNAVMLEADGGGPDSDQKAREVASVAKAKPAQRPAAPPHGVWVAAPVMMLPPVGLLGAPWLQPVPLLQDFHILHGTIPQGGLAASKQTSLRLATAASTVKECFLGQGIPEENIVLYGSLSLVRDPLPGLDQLPPPLAQMMKSGDRESKTYTTDRSDVDYAICLPEKVQAATLVNALLNSDSGAGWRHEQATVVPRFAVSQWTLVNKHKISLDLTCFSSEVQFARFRVRQSGFTEVLWQTRKKMYEKYGSPGMMTFDAYIYLLKGFAGVVPRGAFTGFQAVCLGLFSLQYLLRHQAVLVPSAPWLFNQFVCFCCTFFGKGWRNKGWYKQQIKFAISNANCALDLGGRVMHRRNPRSRAELYFVDAEEKCKAPMTEWQNVLHNSDPLAICTAAEMAVQDWYACRPTMVTWQGRLREDHERPYVPKLSSH